MAKVHGHDTQEIKTFCFNLSEGDLVDVAHCTGLPLLG
jgi:hypothetical protein